MKLVKEVELEDEELQIVLGLITNDVETMSNEYEIKPHEYEKFKKISNLTKKKEWLGARILAELTLSKRVFVDYKLNGAPILLGESKKVSFSHGFPYVGIAFSVNNNVGIDVQEIKPMVLRIKSKFLNNDELLFCGDDLKKLTLFWSAKETLFKLYQDGEVDFKKHLSVEFINNQTMMGHFNNNKTTFSTRLYWFQEQNHVVVYGQIFNIVK